MSWSDTVAAPFVIPLFKGEMRLQRWGETYNQSKLKEALNQGPFPLESTFANIADIIEVTAKETEQFDLAQKWLLSYEGIWDGVDRFSEERSWPTELFKTKNPVWSAIWARMFMLSIVTKIMEPGFPARNYFVIEGNQNVGKSKFCRKLVPSVWHTEKMLFRDTDLTELYRHISSKLIVEFPELGGKDKLTNNTWKMVTTVVKHSFRRMYKDDVTESDNRCIVYRYNK
jgi:predicted P-loop ATPase